MWRLSTPIYEVRAVSKRFCLRLEDLESEWYCRYTPYNFSGRSCLLTVLDQKSNIDSFVGAWARKLSWGMMLSVGRFLTIAFARRAGKLVLSWSVVGKITSLKMTFSPTSTMPHWRSSGSGLVKLCFCSLCVVIYDCLGLDDRKRAVFREISEKLIRRCHLWSEDSYIRECFEPFSQLLDLSNSNGMLSIDQCRHLHHSGAILNEGLRIVFRDADPRPITPCISYVLKSGLSTG